MDSDIPNYVALPLGIIASVVTSTALVIYQDKLMDYVSRNREARLLRKRERVLSFYHRVKRMIDNPAYMSATLFRYSQVLSLGILACLLSFLGATVFLLGKHILLLRQAFQSDADVCTRLLTDAIISGGCEFIAGSDILHVNYLFVTMLFMICASFTRLVIHFSRYMEIARTISRFNEFEAEVKAAWPDDFSSGAED